MLDFHHVLAHCRLLFGESTTASTEAVTLGVPTVFYCDLDYGYIREQVEVGLVRDVRRGEASGGGHRGDPAGRPVDFRARARAFIVRKCDVNSYIADALRAAAEKYRKHFS